MSDDEYREAKRLARMRVIDVVLEVAGDVLKDVIGLTDMEDCFVKGEVGGCVSMAFLCKSSRHQREEWFHDD
ncbi:hypothetical protein [Crossiella sp. CA198]|uniref:hypothetical protein n=1 Tax=Crossiella sp. CA198 TaxID=3455607 RepID=UPI003F8D2968